MSVGGHWVEIEWVVLSAEQRSANVPDDTRRVAYMARTRGLSASREIGASTTVLTPSGRLLEGKIVSTEPGYDHSFGHPGEGWIALREAVRRLVAGPALPPPQQDGPAVV